eukprot:1078722-Prorocentrum_lima.AAC.1
MHHRKPHGSKLRIARSHTDPLPQHPPWPLPELRPPAPCLCSHTRRWLRSMVVGPYGLKPHPCPRGWKYKKAGTDWLFRGQ